MGGRHIRKLLPAVGTMMATLCLAAIADETPPATNPTPQIAPPVVAAPAPSNTVYPELQIPTPPPVIPYPVAPSEPTTTTTTPLPVVTPVPARYDNLIIFYAEDVKRSYEDGVCVLAEATGNVVAQYENMEICAERGRADFKTNIASFEGNVRFKVDTQTVSGERIEINMKTGRWKFFSAQAIIMPDFFKGYIIAPLFTRSQLIEGLRSWEMSATGAEITSCDLAEPHYDLKSRSMSVYPGERIVFRDATAYILGRRLFTLRRLVVPIRDIQRNPELIPRVGNSLEEGAYLKTAFAYMGNRTQSGIILLDLMTRKGIGTGLRHNYNFSNANGQLYAYYIHDNNIDEDTFTGIFSHNQQLGTLKMNFSSDFRANSYLYAPDTKSMINRFTLTRDRVGADTSLAVTQSVNDALVRTTNLTANLQHLQMWSEKTSLDSSFDYISFGSSGSPTRARLTSDMTFARKEEKFDWSLSATKLTDLSDEAFAGTGQFGGIERLPELAVTTDTTRLGRILPFPAKLSLSYGQFAELPSITTPMDRTYININSPIQRICLARTLSLGLGAGFRQFLYGDNTAQYSIDAGAELRKQLGEKSNFALTYRLQQPRGFTPFRFDYIGKYNVVNASLNVQETERLKFSVLTGYNFDQSEFPWQDVVFRCSYQFSPGFLLYTATGYDINNSNWRTLINQIRIRASDAFKLDIGTRYDPTRSKLAAVRSVLDTKLGSKTRLQALAGYNGISNKLDYSSLMLTRDLHCWEVSLMYVNQGGFYRNNGFFINFRIKAFPQYQDYGIGAFGQTLDTSVGQVY